jgi:hypothetical protein
LALGGRYGPKLLLPLKAGDVLDPVRADWQIGKLRPSILSAVASNQGLPKAFDLNDHPIENQFLKIMRRLGGHNFPFVSSQILPVMMGL